MKKNLTELVFILDMSGSMSALTGDTIGGFNSMLKEQREKPGEVLVTTYLFNNDSVMLHDRLPIAKVPEMTGKDYSARGCTALVDAMGGAIRHIAGIHKYAREEDIPEHTIFVITTDGMENASHKFTADHVKDMVRHEQEKYGWEFVFLAANIDAVGTAREYGICPQTAVDYRPDRTGTANAYQAMSRAVGSVRERRDIRQDNSWREDADQDFQNRI